MIPCNFKYELAEYEAREVENDMRQARIDEIAAYDTKDKIKDLDVLAITEALDECQNEEMLECLFEAFSKNDISMIGMMVYRIVYLYWLDCYERDAADSL